MNNETSMYGEITSYMSNNFKVSYYPTNFFINEILDIVDETDIVKVNVVIHDLTLFANKLSDNIEFNRCYMEVLFMFLVNDIIDDDVLNMVIEEYNSGVFEVLVNKDIFIKYNHLINKELISFLLSNIYRLIKRKNTDMLVIGWLKGSNYDIGAMHV